MGIKFNDIVEANASIVTTEIKGNEYAAVNQRIKAFRMLYPEGTIKTELVKMEDGLCVMRAEVWNLDILLGTGTAYEREQSSYINKTSYIENCETSAVGRALGMCGFGIDTSVASKEEVENAIKQQEEIKAEEKRYEELRKQKIGIDRAIALQGRLEDMNVNIPELCKQYKVKELADLTEEQHLKIVQLLNK